MAIHACTPDIDHLPLPLSYTEVGFEVLPMRLTPTGLFLQVIADFRCGFISEYTPSPVLIDVGLSPVESLLDLSKREVGLAATRSSYTALALESTLDGAGTHAHSSRDLRRGLLLVLPDTAKHSVLICRGEDMGVAGVAGRLDSASPLTLFNDAFNSGLRPSDLFR